MGNTASRGLGQGAGLFYVRSDKVGSLWSVGNKEPYVDFPVNPDWAMNLLSSGKMGITNARECMIRCGRNVARGLQNLEALESAQRNAKLALLEAAAQDELATLLRPQRSIPEIESWLASFQRPAFRYKFLVLEGASGLGKTAYIRSLGRTFEVSCGADASFLDLREYSHEDHDVILLDEGSAKLVLRYKRLLQAAPVRVRLGLSATSMYAYSVSLLRLFVGACNGSVRSAETVQVALWQTCCSWREFLYG
jgi:hypothetical protein